MSGHGRVPDGDDSPVSDQGGPFSEQHSYSARLASYATAFRSADEVTQSFQSSYESRIRSGLTLVDCELDFDELTVTVTIDPGPDDDFNPTTVNLDEYVGNHGGRLVWGLEPVNFSDSCSDIRLEGTLLRASCSQGREFVQATLDLSKCITYNTTRRCFEAVIPNRALNQLMSSANWLNFALVTRPDIFTNPIFQDAVRTVAQRSVDDVRNEMKQAMELVIEQAMELVVKQAKFMLEHAMEMVRIRSEMYLKKEMEALAMATANEAGFYGLGGLTIMSLDQRKAYNVFAPTISAARMPEGN